MIEVTHFTDPGCPWAWSASPALAVLRWRFGEQLRWDLRLIGLTEEREQYERRGYTPVRQAAGFRRYAGWGMPFSRAPKPHVAATSRACRLVVAVRLAQPGRELEALRALQLVQFTTRLALDEDVALEAALERLGGVPGVSVSSVDDPEVRAAYEADREAARTAAGSATEAMGAHAQTDGPVRYTAPSLILRAPDGRTLDAGGFQPAEAYDVCLANLDPALERRPPAQDVVEAIRAVGHGLTTREVAAVMAPRLAAPDDGAAEQALVEAAAEGALVHEAVGDGALWTLSS
ncbi:hypothetical protein [Conexibacter sp. SYSU D00693]|uniref:hypothetical protein n=1 Tax=Conexibacter sp. SYSU D00693 TaxID=2812560 RepID=UPI00196ADDB1|nr:hypothetical protein [Conexibacter sp. SYSU D00693]